MPLRARERGGARGVVPGARGEVGREPGIGLERLLPAACRGGVLLRPVGDESQGPPLLGVLRSILAAQDGREPRVGRGKALRLGEADWTQGIRGSSDAALRSDSAERASLPSIPSAWPRLAWASASFGSMRIASR